MSKSKIRKIVFTVSSLLIAAAPTITLFQYSQWWYGEAKYPKKEDYEK